MLLTSPFPFSPSTCIQSIYIYIKVYIYMNVTYLKLNCSLMYTLHIGLHCLWYMMYILYYKYRRRSGHAHWAHYLSKPLTILSMFLSSLAALTTTDLSFSPSPTRSVGDNRGLEWGEWTSSRMRKPDERCGAGALEADALCDARWGGC